ncbi:(Fe-S)-binding protein [Adlercreutzia sp. ZJ305]|nr:(Fe-S)-binding protein [Adlercreutzia sp. ZJ305]
MEAPLDEEDNAMGLLERSDAYWKFLGQCTQCGHCVDACSSLTSANMTLGEIARALLAHERAAESREDLAARILGDGALMQAVRGCFFCTSCKNTCFAHNDVCDLIYNARVDFQSLGLIERGAWSSVMVDQEWDIFTAYRAIHGIGFADLVRHVEREEHAAETDCAVAFFPGCSLAAYGPDLTREIFATMEELGGKTTMIDHCCGSPLKSAGFFERAEALCDRIADEVALSGAREIVCVCPGCANAMRSTLGRRGLDVAVSLLPAFLTAHGFTSKRALPEGTLCLSKSCQDRDGHYLEETCRALGVAANAGAAGAAGGAGAAAGMAGGAGGADGTTGTAPGTLGATSGTPGAITIFSGCCGAGGAVSAFDPNRQASQADSKLSFAPDGATVVTMCPTCTYTYAFRLTSEPRDVANKHYAELLFESQLDWDAVFAQLGGMWSGEYGPWLAQVFA